MRIGLLADIHANLPALETALRELRAANVDVIAVAGDTVGYGPFPNECIDALRARHAVAVAGNHELFLTEAGSSGTYGAAARQSLLWTKERLGDAQWQWLRTLPRVIQVAGIVVTHGSLESPHEYVVRPRQVDRQLELLRQHHPDATALVLGHTHTQLFREDGRRTSFAPLRRRVYSPSTRVVVNPGSVGQSRQWEPRPRVRFAVLDAAAREVRWFAMRYDHEATARGLIAAGLPPAGIHSRPTAAAALARVLRRGTDFRWRRRPYSSC